MFGFVLTDSDKSKSRDIKLYLRLGEKENNDKYNYQA